MPPTTVVIVMAMKAEAMPLIAALDLKPLEIAEYEPFGAAAFRATVSPAGHAAGPSIDVILVHLGTCDRFAVDNIGTQPATLLTYLAIQRFRPGLVLSAGTCGGFVRRGAAIGTVYVSHNKIIFHDRRIAIPGFDSYGLGSYPPAQLAAHATHLGLELGVISSGNALDLPAADEAIMDAHHAVAKDMEAAAVAWVCERLKTPMGAVKAVTDLVDSGRPTADEFLDNLHRAAQALSRAMVGLLGCIAQRDARPS